MMKHVYDLAGGVTHVAHISGPGTNVAAVEGKKIVPVWTLTYMHGSFENSYPLLGLYFLTSSVIVFNGLKLHSIWWPVVSMNFGHSYMLSAPANEALTFAVSDPGNYTVNNLVGYYLLDA